MEPCCRDNGKGAAKGEKKKTASFLAKSWKVISARFMSKKRSKDSTLPFTYTIIMKMVLNI